MFLKTAFTHNFNSILLATPTHPSYVDMKYTINLQDVLKLFVFVFGEHFVLVFFSMN